MTVTQILPNLRAIDFHGRVWAYLYEDADSFTLIDTGIAGDEILILDAIAASGHSVSYLRQIILTHCHKDHAGTAEALQRRSGARVLAHRLDAPVIRGEEMPTDPVLTEPERAIFNAATLDMPDADPTVVHRELEDGDEIDLDGGARVIHAPGHTPGSIAIHVPRSRTLFTGDAAAAVGSRPFLGFFNVDGEQARQSVRRLAELDFDIGCFGHGPPLTKGAMQAFRRLAETL